MFREICIQACFSVISNTQKVADYLIFNNRGLVLKCTLIK